MLFFKTHSKLKTFNEENLKTNKSNNNNLFRKIISASIMSGSGLSGFGRNFGLGGGAGFGALPAGFGPKVSASLKGFSSLLSVKLPKFW
jgi:hypothetical protein